MNKKYFTLFSAFTLSAGFFVFTRCASEELDMPSGQQKAIDQEVIDNAFEYAYMCNAPGLTAIIKSHPGIVNKVDVFGKSLLHHARTASIAKLLLDGGANVHATDNYGQTPLLKASWASHVSVIKKLLEAGVSAKAIDKNGLTPLFSTKDPDVARLLLQAGADVDATNNHGETHLHHPFSAALARVLLDNGADVDAIDKYGRNPLYWVTTATRAQVSPIENFYPNADKHFKTTKLIAHELLSHFPFVNSAQKNWLDQHISNWRRDRAEAFSAVRKLFDNKNIPKAVVESIVVSMLGEGYPHVAQSASAAQEPPRKRQKQINA